jgi:hypothetical protein
LREELTGGAGVSVRGREGELRGGFPGLVLSRVGPVAVFSLFFVLFLFFYFLFSVFVLLEKEKLV